MPLYTVTLYFTFCMYAPICILLHWCVGLCQCYCSGAGNTRQEINNCVGPGFKPWWCHLLFAFAVLTVCLAVWTLCMLTAGATHPAWRAYKGWPICEGGYPQCPPPNNDEANKPALGILLPCQSLCEMLQKKVCTTVPAAVGYWYISSCWCPQSKSWPSGQGPG